MKDKLQHWESLEGICKTLQDAMERAARDRAWSEDDIEKWDEVYEAMRNRPCLSLAQRKQLEREAWHRIT